VTSKMCLGHGGAYVGVGAAKRYGRDSERLLHLHMESMYRLVADAGRDCATFDVYRYRPGRALPPFSRLGPAKGRGFVYVALMRADTSATCVKVGFTMKHPLSRIKALQQGLPFPLTLVASGWGHKSRENRLQSRLRGRGLRLRGEWFAAPAEWGFAFRTRPAPRFSLVDLETAIGMDPCVWGLEEVGQQSQSKGA